MECKGSSTWQDTKAAYGLSRWWSERSRPSWPRGAKPARRADLLVGVAHITMQPPRREADDPGVWLERLLVWAIWLHEERSAEGVESLDWALTNVAIATWLDAAEPIGYSCVRPGIESWHKILKPGCSVEDCRLEEAERLKPYLALMGVVARRFFWLTHINRQTPSAPCTTILAEQNGKRSLPPSIARRPFQRKGDGEPGITTLWRGWS
jgi:hypothetical protein